MTFTSTHNSANAFAAMVARQRLELQADAVKARALRVAAFEAECASAVPIRARLVSLLGEARRAERQRALSQYVDATNNAGPHLLAEKAQHLAMIDTGYRNLLTDVNARCRAIAKAEGATDAQLWQIGTEAIGCFSSMLPWSDGIATKDAPTPAVVAPLPTSLTAARMNTAIKTRVVGGVAGVPVITVQHRVDPMSTVRTTPIVLPRWTVPSRLNTDNKKLAATVAARRRLLQRMCASGSCGSSASSLGMSKGDSGSMAGVRATVAA